MTDYLKQFDAILDAAETDPRARWRRAVAEILAREFAQVPPDIANDLSRSYLRELANHLRQALEEHRIRDADKLLSDFQLQMRRQVQNERTNTNGRLVPVCAETELRRCQNMIVVHKWNGAAEHDTLLAMIADGERIKTVEFWSIVTDKRTITRNEVRAFQKPATWSNKNGSWESQFISDSKIAEAEKTAQRQATLYAPGSDSRNWDLPNGIRQS